MTSVGEDFPVQQERVRRLIEEYKILPDGTGMLGVVLMDQVLVRATKAQSSGDVIQILQSYQELVGCE